MSYLSQLFVGQEALKNLIEFIKEVEADDVESLRHQILAELLRMQEIEKNWSEKSRKVSFLKHVYVTVEHSSMHYREGVLSVRVHTLKEVKSIKEVLTDNSKLVKIISSNNPTSNNYGNTIRENRRSIRGKKK